MFWEIAEITILLENFWGQGGLTTESASSPASAIRELGADLKIRNLTLNFQVCFFFPEKTGL